MCSRSDLREAPLAPSSRPHQSTTGNLLLDLLPAAGLEALRPHCKTVKLRPDQAMQEPGRRAAHVFFPTSGMISVLVAMAGGTAVEIGLVGREGMLGVPAVLGDDTPSHKAVVQLAGSAIRVRSVDLERVGQAHPELRSLLLRYAQFVMINAMQSAGCNRLHQLEPRCARWLLSAHDRAETDTFAITHEYLALMLGVRRPGVTVAVQSLREHGLITYNHGTMTILDRAGLMAASCECYGFIRHEAERLIGSG